MRRLGEAVGIVALAGLTWLAVPGLAHAGGGGDGQQSTGMVVLVILGIAAMYLLAHFVVDRLQRRFLVMAGVEYVLLGIMLGPSSQMSAFENLSGVMPFIALAAGWIGLLRGMDLDVRALEATPLGATRIVLTSVLLVGGAVAAASWYGLMFVFGEHVAWQQIAVSAGVLACCAAAAAPTPIDLLTRRYAVAGRLVPLLRRATRLTGVVSILAFGLVFAMFHEPDPRAKLVLTPTEWAVVEVLVGAVLGVLFRPFLGGDESPNARFLALVGVITFASGAAYFLRLSPLMVNLVLGIVLVNTAKTGGQIRGTLESTEKPMTLVLLVLAGALWRPPPIDATIVAAIAFVVLRFAASFVATHLAAWGTPLRGDLYRGMLGQGEVTVAMAVSFQLVYDGPVVDLAYTVLLVSVVLHDLIAPRMLRALLVDAGDIRKEGQEPAPADVPPVDGGLTT